ncbi:MAG: EAL domain-containing protein, partial [Chloroflexota bacterium]|nr:EAL domain-containing protein [Chloroflexota bacterium]
AQIGSWEADPATGRLSWSDENYRIFGLEPGECKPSLETFLNFVHPEDREGLLALVPQALENAGEFQHEYQIIRRDGEERVISSRFEAVHDDAGKVVRLRGTNYDITERRRAEKRTAALSALGQQLSSATSAVSAARIIADAADELLSWDAFSLLIHSPDDGLLHEVLDFDLKDGQRVECPPDGVALSPGPISRRVLAGERVLLLSQSSIELAGLQSFGDEARTSASLIFVPIHGSSGVIGVLSVQSYTPMAYSESDVETMQALADHCGGALERIHSQEELRRSEERFRSLVQNASDVIDVIATDGTILYISPAIERVLGYRPEERIGRSAFDSAILPPDDSEKFRTIFAQIMEDPDATVTIEVRARHRDGSWRDLEGVLRNRSDDPAIGGIVINYRDITERKALEEQLRHQAFHDPLTGLPNRALFLDRLEHALVRGTRQGRSLAVLFVDLDRFKPVNDSLGHEVGDELLTAVARRLRDCLRPEDTVARLGGDEFVVLIEDVEDRSGAMLVAERIGEAIRQSYELGDREVVLTASVGVALSTVGRVDPGELLRAADIAMYRAKRTGKARYEVYEPLMGSRALELLELEADLRRGIDRGELRLHYQPKVELDTGRIVGVEALLRWEHPHRGMVSPAEFIGLAEETGLILPIGRWVLGEACRQVQVWRKECGTDPEFDVCVNVAPRQFAHPGLVQEVTGVLEETGLGPKVLLLEITESAVMGDAESNAATLHELKDLGVRLAIDDFGTGYSSLSYLHRFPVDYLKIDRSFVDGLGRESDDTAIVRAVIGLAHSLRLEVIAEGVESAEQVELLRSLGCRFAQGYYFARPMTSDAVGALLAKGGRLGTWPLV